MLSYISNAYFLLVSNFISFSNCFIYISGQVHKLFLINLSTRGNREGTRREYYIMDLHECNILAENIIVLINHLLINTQFKA